MTKKNKQDKSILVITISEGLAQRDIVGTFCTSKSKFDVKKSLRVAHVICEPLGNFTDYKSVGVP